jgi:hypothetical protein
VRSHGGRTPLCAKSRPLIHLDTKVEDILVYRNGIIIVDIIDLLLLSGTLFCCCHKIIESMPRRVEAVLRVKGGHTKY